MEKTLLIYAVLFTITLTAAVLLAMRSSQTFSQNLAKVRVRVDDRRHERPEPPDDEFDPQNQLTWLVVGFIVILVLMLASQI